MVSLVTDVNTFCVLENVFSRERMQTYLDAADGNRAVALQHYTRNVQLGAAFHGPLQALEITLRNAIHDQLAAHYGSHWYMDPAPGLDNHARNAIDGQLKHGGSALTPGPFVASMSLGFWVRLLGRGSYVNGGGKADYERTLWRPALFKAFPGRQRRTVQQRLNRLRQLRNRIAHHEPVFDRNLTEDYALLLETVGWISADVRAWIEAHSTLPDALQAPLSNPIRF